MVESLQSALIWIFMSRKDVFWVECSEVNVNIEVEFINEVL